MRKLEEDNRMSLDATLDSLDIERLHPNILEEANKVVGPQDRGADYGHPLDNFEMEAKFMNVWLEYRNRNELNPEAKIQGMLTAKDMAIHKIFMKIAREANRHKRDNSVDIAGYAWCLEEAIAEEKRRYG